MSGRSRGGRGGRGGFGRGGRPTNGHRTIGHDAPFSIDIDVTLDGKPSEQFPEYDVPKPPALTKKEEKQVDSFLLFREQCHDSPLYTHARAWKKDPSGAGKRAYGQEQINKRYKDDNMIDPFTAVPTYSQRFQVVPRNLPDLTKRPFALEFFPPELHSTLTGSKKNANVNKSLVLSSITSYKTVEDLEAERLALTANQTGGETDYTHALEILKKAADAGEEGGLLLGEDDDDWVKKNGENEDEDEDGQNAQVDEYDDESGDDYDAEQYFEGNQDDDDYDDAGDDGEAYY